MEEKENSLILIISFIIGIISSLNIVKFVNILLLLIIIICLTKRCGLLIILNRKPVVSIILILSMFCLGFLRGYVFERKYNSDIRSDSHYSNSAIVKRSEGKDLFIIKLKANPNCLVLLRSKHKLIPGMKIDINCYLEIPKNALNKGGFSYREFLKNRNIKFITNSEEIKNIKQVKNLDFFLYKYQDKYLRELKTHLGDRIRFVDSIFLGNSKSMTDNEISTWRNMGILHLQAVSGSQIGATLDLLMFIFILTPKKGIFKYVIFTLPLILYGLMTDSPSVWRAILYLFIIKILQIHNENKYEMFALCLSMLLLLIVNPGMLFHISFQLSYVLTIGLLMFRDKIFYIDNKFFRIIFIGCLSIILSWPLLMQYFQEVSIFGIIFTPIFAPFIQLIIFISCIFMLLPYSITILKPLVYILNNLLIILEKTTDFFSKFNLLTFKGRPWGFLIISVFYIFLIFINNRVFRKKYRQVFIILFAGIIICNIIRPFFDKNYVCVTFINVGQGDCILIECKNSKEVILIDGGVKNEYIDMGKNEVAPYLRRKGINKIDYMISTHSDNDHRGGLETILEEFQVSKILIPYNNANDYSDWISKYSKKVIEINQGYKIILGDINIDILNPLKLDDKLDSNETSIVLNLTYGNSNILLTADCGIDVLERLALDNYNFDIIKAPHHGSKYSYRENIYSQLKAKSVIFSVGKNLYGHPSKEIITDLNLDKIDYYRTDNDKDIIIRLKNNKVYINNKKYVD